MNKTTIQSADGTPLCLRQWGKEGPDLLIVPGQGEHGGRYAHVGAALSEAGLRVWSVDLRGHGESGGRRGHVARWSDYWEDVYAAARAVGRPLVVLGHSMGGLVGIGAILAGFPVPLRGFITTNPMFLVRMPVPGWKMTAARVLSRLVPILPIPLELDPANTSHDPEIVRGYMDDPLLETSMTTRWGALVQAEMTRILASGPRFTWPLLVLVSSSDPIIDAAGGKRFASEAAGPTKTVDYGEMYHEILNEIGKEKVFADILAWVSELPVGAT